MNPSEVPPGIDPKATFRLSVRISQFSAELDDGSCMDVQRKCYEWVVDYRCYTLEKLVEDLAERVKWGSWQHPVISEFDMSSGAERILEDDASLSLAFSERLFEKKLFLFVDVEHKPIQLVCNSVVTEGVMSDVVVDNGSTLVDRSDPPDVTHVIDWDSIEILQIEEEQIGTAVTLMDEEAMYNFVGLRDEDEQAKQTAENQKEAEHDGATSEVPLDLEGADLTVVDVIPGEESVFYDMEDPPMSVGSRYASMKEFRAAVRQHAIKGQFDFGIEKSCKDRFRGYCKAEGCPWAIVARLMVDGKQVRVQI